MKLNKRHFEFFKKEYMYWFDKFCLEPYTVKFKFENGSSDFKNACFNHDYDNHIVTIWLYPEYEIVSSSEINNDLKITAKHEAIHLLLGELSVLGGRRYITRMETYRAEEEVVRKLEKLIK